MAIYYEWKYGQYRLELSSLPIDSQQQTDEVFSKLHTGYDLYQQQKYQASLEIGKSLIDCNLHRLNTLVLIGVSALQLGNYAEAKAYISKAIELEPNNPYLYQYLNMIQPLKINDPAFPILLDIIAREDISPDQEETAHFLLSYIYDNAEEYDSAFTHARTGNDISKRLHSYSTLNTTREVSQLIKHYNADLFNLRYNQCGDMTYQPVFIVGMPRSGTTLVEKIIGKHPDITGCDELKVMPTFFLDIQRDNPGKNPYFASTQLGDQAIEYLATTYRNYVDERYGTVTRPVDKMPSNFFRLGLIALLFPNARIINVNRNPIDTCLSCYLQAFPEGQYFTTDLRYLIEYYSEYTRMMEHWRQVLPLPILDVQYEDLVNDQKTTSRRMTDFLDLPWNEQCMEFYKLDTPSTTSSRHQVNKPIYSNSIGRWRNYRKHIAPLIEAFRAYS